MAKILEKLNADITELTYKKETETKSVLKMVKSHIQLAIKKSGKDLSYEEELDIIRKEIKQREESIKQFASRVDFVDKLQSEIEIIKLYLPKFINEWDTDVIVTKVLSEHQLSMKKDFKVAVNLVLSQADNIDRVIVSKILQKRLV